MHRLLKKYFGGRNRDINPGQFEQTFMKFDFKTMDNTDALKIVMFYFADRVLNGRKKSLSNQFQFA